MGFPISGSLYPVLCCVVFLLVVGCSKEKPLKKQSFNTEQIAPYVEPDFPFITTAVDARGLGSGFPEDNLVPRCLALRLGEQAYACFDTDLLRWSVAWNGEFLPMVAMPHVSYRDFYNKKNDIPRIPGKPKIATGNYPGWSTTKRMLSDPRPPSPNPKAPSWGPIPEKYGRWNGMYLHGRDVVLDYSVQDVDIIEKPGAITRGDHSAFTRTFRVDRSNSSLSLVAAEVTNGVRSEVNDTTAYVYQGASEDTVTAIGIKESDTGVDLHIKDERYVTVRLSGDQKQRQFSIVLWRGPSDQISSFHKIINQAETGIPDFRDGGPAYWEKTVHTKGQLSPDTSAYVTDLLTLPSPNPWNRNVRAVDVSFFDEDRAAVVTFEGDVWIVNGIDKDLERLEWHRYASGLHEPQSIEVVADTIYVFGREGIVRFHDLNKDGVADYYENFSNLMAQSMETREWASDMVAAPGGGFYIAKAGAGDAGPKILSSAFINGFRYGTRHSGTIMKVASDGRSIQKHATGLRAPYLGINPENGSLSASDQQGFFVPSTPIWTVDKGDYFGVPATAHKDDIPKSDIPLMWLPHNVDRSGASQVWINNDEMGPLSNHMIHLSLGKPGMFKVMIDSTDGTIQGGASFIHADYPAPTIKGEVNPGDGQLYATGFDLWGSNAKELSALIRLRYTGKQSYLPMDFKVVDKGIMISFGTKIDPASATKPANYNVKRWNYKRTENYGSGHFKLDGSPGEESLPVRSVFLSDDSRSVFLAIPDIQKTMQMQIAYDLKTVKDKPFSGKMWLTVNSVPETQNLLAEEFSNLDIEALNLDVPSEHISQSGTTSGEVSLERGRTLFQQSGCIGCHSLDGEDKGYYGTTMKGLYGSERILGDSTTVIADKKYIRESILSPEKKVVRGYAQEMPTFQGILSENEIESIIIFIKSL